jgi:hypothetical protein
VPLPPPPHSAPPPIRFFPQRPLRPLPSLLNSQTILLFQ